jgi:hypothetical protein
MFCCVARPGIPSSDNFLMEGQWFMAMGFFLLPNENSLVADLKLALTKAHHPRRRHRERRYGKLAGSVTREVAEALTHEISALFKDCSTSFATFYNAQPQWSLVDLVVESPDQLEQCVQEFLRLAEHTANKFFWPGKIETKGAEWRRHGWKHISYSVLRRFVDDEKTSLPPAMQADLLGTSEKFLEVVRDAVDLNPRAIARLEHCFPKRDDLIEALESVTHDIDLIAAARRLPTAGELAATWASTAIRDPDSADAEKARQDLQQLVFKGSALTSSSMGGRPPIHTHPDSILSVYRMSYCLVRQILEVWRFLDEHGESDKAPSFLSRHYPWLRDVSGIRDRSPSDAAVQLCARCLDMSPSKVSKAVYKPQR